MCMKIFPDQFPVFETSERILRKLLDEHTITRGQFLKLCAGTATYCSARSILAPLIHAQTEYNGRTKRTVQTPYDLAVAHGNDPFQMTVQAVRALGGMEKFVKKNSVVVVKPNIGWDREPEQAGNTNPDVVAALVELCYKAGARRVNVFDITCNDPRRCYANSGIQKAAEAKGAMVFIPDDWNMVKARFSKKSPMQDWPIFRDALSCDTLINVPIVKHHSLTRLTLSIKNLMGVCGGSRGSMHFNIGEKLSDLTGFMQPDLTVIDAFRVLMRHGPSGGNLEDVALKNTVIAGTDPVLADSYASRLMDRDPSEIPYIETAARQGLGSRDLSVAKIEHINISP
ncbi:MAG: DUF362 domain-containing protein [Elusimicrobia bacterium]|nr:DUF362 domain-containing protein [Elusimicrobiota bacterium]MBD3411925.1 DUF362 domain-containing protein [Elusimicrobiota bacterium]